MPSWAPASWMLRSRMAARPTLGRPVPGLRQRFQTTPAGADERELERHEEGVHGQQHDDGDERPDGHRCDLRGPGSTGSVSVRASPCDRGRSLTSATRRRSMAATSIDQPP